MPQRRGRLPGIVRAGGRAVDQVDLHLAVAVRTEKDALLRFFAEGGERSAQVGGYLEGLGRRIHVVEVEVEDAAVVATYRAAATRLRNQRSPDLLLPARDRFAVTSPASPAHIPILGNAPVMNLDAVAWARSHVLGRWLDGGRAPSSRNDRPWRLGTVALWLHEHMFPHSPDGFAGYACGRGCGPKVGQGPFKPEAIGSIPSTPIIPPNLALTKNSLDRPLAGGTHPLDGRVPSRQRNSEAHDVLGESALDKR